METTANRLKSHAQSTPDPRKFSDPGLAKTKSSLATKAVHHDPLEET